MNNGPKCARDLNRWAKRMLDMTMGEVEDPAPTPDEEGKDLTASLCSRKRAISISTGGEENLSAAKLRCVLQQTHLKAIALVSDPMRAGQPPAVIARKLSA